MRSFVSRQCVNIAKYHDHVYNILYNLCPDLQVGTINRETRLVDKKRGFFDKEVVRETVPFTLKDFQEGAGNICKDIPFIMTVKDGVTKVAVLDRVCGITEEFSSSAKDKDFSKLRHVAEEMKYWLEKYDKTGHIDIIEETEFRGIWTILDCLNNKSFVYPISRYKIYVDCLEPQSVIMIPRSNTNISCYASPAGITTRERPGLRKATSKEVSEIIKVATKFVFGD